MIFRERQTFAPWVYGVILLGPFIGVVFPETRRDHGGILTISFVSVAVALLILALFGIMTTTVDRSEVRVTFGFMQLIRFRYPLGTIARAEQRIYRPIVEFGGWGIRGFGNKRALNVRGNDGVELTIPKASGDSTVMIGSQRGIELERAINEAMSHRGGV